MYNNLHFYIDLDWEKQAQYPETYIHDLYKIVDFVYLHKGTVYYNPKQIDDFRKNCEDWDKEFRVSYGEKVDILLQNALPKNSQNYFFEVEFANEHSSIKHINKSSISIIEPIDKVSIISLSYSKSGEIQLIRINTSGFEKINLTVHSSTQEVKNYITTSIRRTFNESHKHGNKYKTSWKGASALLTTKDKAQILLSDAVGDFSKKTNRLFNFDNTEGTFIEFFYEGDTPQNQWHGFHLKPEHWNTRVPSRVRKHFGK